MNSNAVVQVIPHWGKGNPAPARIKVSTLRGRERVPAWEAGLKNEVAPVQVLVSEDGASVVTFDEWGGKGYGDNVAVIYGKQGMLKRYSLETLFLFLHPKKKTDPLDPDALDSLSLRGKFSHSVSSRNWRESSIGFFDGEGRYCLWLGWAKRWLAWELDTGELMPTAEHPGFEWIEQARGLILGRSRQGIDTTADYKFLGSLRRFEDRELLRAWLQDSDFGCGSISRSSGTETEFRYYAHSHRREAADLLFTEWDKVPKATKPEGLLSHQHPYSLLGSLDVSVTFPEAPQKKEGRLILYLQPVDAKNAPKRPVHRAYANLDYSYPYEGSLKKTVDFSLRGVTPGSYQVMMFWDRKPPFTTEQADSYQPGPGDVVSVETRKVRIEAGVEARFEMDCRFTVGKDGEAL